MFRRGKEEEKKNVGEGVLGCALGYVFFKKNKNLGLTFLFILKWDLGLTRA